MDLDAIETQVGVLSGELEMLSTMVHQRMNAAKSKALTSGIGLEDEDFFIDDPTIISDMRLVLDTRMRVITLMTRLAEADLQKKDKPLPEDSSRRKLIGDIVKALAARGELPVEGVLLEEPVLEG